MSTPEVRIPGTPAQKPEADDIEMIEEPTTVEDEAVAEDTEDVEEEESQEIAPIKKPTFLEYVPNEREVWRIE